MIRTPEQVLAAMRDAAALTPFDAEGSWADALFDGDALSTPGEPDRALLAAVAAELSQVDAHVATLPGRMHLHWLESILGIPRLPVVPDHVVAHATVDPRLAPVVVAPGTVLRGGKDAAGRERRYATADALTAHGATLVGVRSLVPGGSAAGDPGVAASAPAFPLVPTVGPDAPHALRISSPVLAFAGGTMTVRLTFDGSGSAAPLAGAMWHHVLPSGAVSPPQVGSVSGTTVTITMSEGCGVPGATPWIEAVIPAHVPVPTSLSFTGVRVAVTARTPFVPDAAYFNDGAVDVTKECQPFPVTAAQGDAFYVGSDEALAKPLATLTLTLTKMPVPAAAGSLGTVFSELMQGLHQLYWTQYGPWGTGAVEGVGAIAPVVEAATSLVWQRRVDGDWQEFTSSGTQLNGFSAASIGDDPGSEPFTVGGRRGRYVRAFLRTGDFGWMAYQAALADFATQAVGGGEDSAPTMPVPPVARTVTSLALTYTTTPVPASAVEAVNGWSRTSKPTGSTAWTPFTRWVSPASDTGMLAVGLALPASAAGSSVSLFLDVDSASPCGSSADPAARWEYWDGAAWQPLVVADGTRLLREAGLLRFVFPTDWALGCADVSAAEGRWVRLVTTAPDRLGVVRAVTPDAVVAHFMSSAPDPATDPSPQAALPPGTIKGALSPIRGVKKVTNLVGVRGRGPEEDGAYARRATAHARHRGRAITAWDYEEHVAIAFPEVAAVRCLPHTAPDGMRALGHVGLVVVPDRPGDPAPRPSVSLSGRIADTMVPLMPMHATASVLCAAYVPVSVHATVRLRRGVAALTGRDAVRDGLEAYLHPTATTPMRWGRALYRSSLEAFLERIGVVDSVEAVTLLDPDGTAVELVEVDACRGLYCSSGSHVIDAQEQL